MDENNQAVDGELTEPAAAQEQLQRARQALAQAQTKSADFIRQHPVVCLSGALVAGYLLGRVAARRWLR